MTLNFSFNEFPRLNLRSEDRSGSWKSWLSEFQLCVEIVTLRLGYETGTTNDKFAGRIKLLVLLKAIGKDGRDALTSVGFDMESQTSTYKQAMDQLKTIFDIEETVYVKTMKFVTASQTSGEKENEFLLRVEKLSRSMNFGVNEDFRKEFSLAIAVNGLRSASLRRQLMQQTDLTWNVLKDKISARKLARESEAIMAGSEHSEASLEVAVVRSKGTASNDIASNSKCNDDLTVNRVSSKRYRSNKNDSHSERYYRHDSRKPSRCSYNKPDYHSDHRRDFSKSSRDSSEDRHSNWRNRESYSKCKTRKLSPKRDSPCFGCGDNSHMIRECPLVKCYSCDRYGHTSVDCYARYSKNSRRGNYSDSSKESSSSSSDSDSSSDSRSYRNRRYHKEYYDKTKPTCVRFSMSNSEQLDGKIFSTSDSNRPDGKIVSTLKVNGMDVDFTLDTGADVSTVTVETSKTLGLDLANSDRHLSGADGSSLNVKGFSKVCLESTSKTVNAPIYVLRGSKRNLLGRSELKKLDLWQLLMR